MLEIRIPIRWRDMDAYGHVNNATYLTYLEECRDAWVQRTIGSVADPWHFVLAHLEIDYRAELTQDDGEVIVRCGLERIGRASVRTREDIRKLDGSTSALAAAVIVPRDPDGGGSRPLSGDERRVLERELGSGPSPGAS
jgi:acyl-CoA thioester hydrolase